MHDVIVIGTYSIALGVIRSLGMVGYKVRLLALNEDTKKIAGKSKYVTKSIYLKYNENKIIDVLDLLRGDDEKILIISLNDRYSKFIDHNYNILKEHYYLCNIDNEECNIDTLMDKMYQKRLAQEYGLNTAFGKEYNTEENGISDAIKEVKYPCFMKPLASADIPNSKTAFAICSNEAELTKAMKVIREKGGKNVLIEEYLNISQELCLYGIAWGNGAWAPVLILTLRGGVAEHKGVTAEGVAISSNKIKDIKEKIENLVKGLKLTGMFCVDLFDCDNKIYFSEINIRGGGSGYAATLAGINFPAILVDMFYKQKVECPDDIAREVRFQNERILFDTFRRGYISQKEFDNQLNMPLERFIESADDPKPWQEFRKMVRLYKLKKFVRCFVPKNMLSRHKRLKEIQ